MDGTARLETFSDGVFAIAATLLVLEISITVEHGQTVGDALLHIWPSYIAYVTSFLIIGIVWINHHHIVGLMRRVDRTFLFLNLLLLLLIAFLPFPTRLVAEYLNKPGERDATLAYAITLFLMAVLYNIWWRYARGNRRLIRDEVPDSSQRAVDRAFNPGVLAYGIVVGLVFVSPLAAVFGTLALAVFYVPSAALFDRAGEPL